MLAYEDAIIEEGLYAPYLIKTKSFTELATIAAEVLRDVGLKAVEVLERELPIMSGFALASFIAANTSFSTDDEGWLEHCREICSEADDSCVQIGGPSEEEPEEHPSETDEERNGAMSSWRIK